MAVMRIKRSATTLALLAPTVASMSHRTPVERPHRSLHPRPIDRQDDALRLFAEVRPPRLSPGQGVAIGRGLARFEIDIERVGPGDDLRREPDHRRDLVPHRIARLERGL